MSRSHLRIDAVGDAWMIRDQGSRNGSLLNGIARGVMPVADGDLVEAGHTLLLFGVRTSVPSASPDAAPCQGGAPGLATIQPELAQRFSVLERLAASEVPLLVEGETGAGKELVARAIHGLSRRAGPLIAVNCGAIPATLVETELFGYRRGAFSGANEDRAGLVRSAAGGTLFLDEIGDLPLASQPALLRVLQERAVRPVGSTQPVKVDVRVVAATNHRLPDLVARGVFRADLVARLSGHVLRLPPLRERREDLGLFIATLLDAASAAATIEFTQAAARALFLYGWPMNARELARCIETAVVLAAGGPIDIDHFPDALRGSSSGATSVVPEPRASSLSPEDVERRNVLAELLRAHDGNVSAVARAMGKGRAQIHRWLRRYALSSNGR
jgi:DNA-binding NtrC family response regulator